MLDPSDGSGKSRRVVLVIDEDPKIGRLVRLSLHGPTCQVLASARYLEGLQMASRFHPNLILMETSFGKTDGLGLALKLMQASATKSSTIAFLTRDSSFIKQIEAIQMGAADYIRKPVEGKTLSARVEAIFAKVADNKRRGPVTGPAVAPLLNMLRQIEADAATGVVSLNRPGESARIGFNLGVLQRAECADLVGGMALTAIASAGDWEISFKEGERLPGTLSKVPTTQHVGPEDVEDTDSASTAPRLAAIRKPAGPAADRLLSDSKVQTLLERPPAPAPRGSPGLAPEQELSPIGSAEADADDRTLVDPSHPGPLPFNAATAPKMPAKPDGEPRKATSGTAPFFAEEAAALDLSTTDEFVEDVSTPIRFKALESMETPTAQASPKSRSSADPTIKDQPAGPPPVHAAPEHPAHLPAAGLSPAEDQLPPNREYLRRLLQQAQSPILVIVPNEKVRSALLQSAATAGFLLQCVPDGQQAYAAALQQRPLAFLVDTQLPDMSGRQFLGAVRLDFSIRETPLLIISGEALAQKIDAVGDAAVIPILNGLETALAPRALLLKHLDDPTQSQIAGRVEPIGTATLLRTIGAATASGRLELRNGEHRRAEVVFAKGEICGATVNVPSAFVGPLAAMHLMGYEWQDYIFTPGQRAMSNVPLGSLDQLVETACHQNNVLISMIYHHGIQLEDVTVNRAALDLYLQTLPPGSLELLIRLVEGEPAATLAAKGVAAPGLLMSMLHDLRRKAVICPTSLRPVRANSDVAGLFPGPHHAAASPARGRRRWLVALAAGLCTMALAAAGYLVLWRLVGF